jgi:hypothetical protein
MRNKKQLEAKPTFETVWATLQENAQQLRETERIFKEQSAEADRRFAETERFLNEKFAETDRLMKENAERQKETDRQIKELNKKYGGISDSNGKMAEEYFYRAFKKDKTFVSEHFDFIKRSFICINDDDDGALEAELDILLFNGSSAAIIEVKYCAKKDNIDIPQLIERVEIIKRLYPHYANHKFYLGVAAMSFDKGLPPKLHRAGIATVRQIGKKMVIYDKEVKAF